MRLQKYMAHCGVGSRRKCEDMIKEGRVQINGKKVTEMGLQVDPDHDKVVVDSISLRLQEDMIYILLNKPKGTITSVSDQFNRNTVIDQIGWKGSRIYPIGRLDYNTEGLIILTNDGEMAYHMTHPKHQIEKEYMCVVSGIPDAEKIDMLRRGIDIGGFITSPAQVSYNGQEKGNAIIHIVIKEGKNRQVRRMLDAIEHPVIYLRRERIANIIMNDLKIGEWRYLTENEVDDLKKL